jgi:hypothetical protein
MVIFVENDANDRFLAFAIQNVIHQLVVFGAEAQISLLRWAVKGKSL